MSQDACRLNDSSLRDTTLTNRTNVRHIFRDVVSYPAAPYFAQRIRRGWVRDHRNIRSDSNTNLIPLVNDQDTIDPPFLAEGRSTLDSQILNGWRLGTVTIGLCLSLMLSSLETTIVATALLDITNEFKDFERGGWIVVSYFLTYTGFLVVFAKLSDNFGQKVIILVAICIFTGFSILCGISQSLNQLIVFRAFQGIGGSGIYSIVMVLIPIIVAPAKVGIFSGIIGSVFGLSSVLGPVLGGAITDESTWRWVFWLNGPVGFLATIILFFSLPNHRRNFYTLNKTLLHTIDWVGILLSLSATVLFVFALQEGGVDYPWRGGVIITILSLSALLFIAFGLWEHRVTTQSIAQSTAIEALFPTNLMTHRIIGSLLACAFFMGFGFVALVITLPQRFQVVNQLSATRAGLHMLPLLLGTSLAAAVGGAITGKYSNSGMGFYMLFLGACLQVIGIGLLSTIPDGRQVSVPQYVYQTLFGFGCGVTLPTFMIMAKEEVDQGNLAVAMGSITMLRTLGGTIGLSISTSLLHRRLRLDLSVFLNSTEVEVILKTASKITQLSPESAERTRVAYAASFDQQTRIMTVFAACALIAAAFTWRRSAVNNNKT